MKILACIRNAWLVAVAILSFPLTSCNGVIFDEEGDCSVYYRLKFRYDNNLKWADAFAHEVTSVHMYAFDPSGVLVWQKEERIEPSQAEDYSMQLDLPAGDYKLLAWCGLQNDGSRGESFSVAEARVGETRIEQLQCSLNRKRDGSGAYSDERLYRLFHGTLDVTLPSDDDGGSYEYTMSLTKNTNHIRVILQHLSGEDVIRNKFDFRIDDENGLMGHDNGLLEDEIINYRPWDSQDSEAGMEKDDTRAVISGKGAVADLTIGRMMWSHHEKMFLTITNEDKEIVARVPVVDYAVMAKDYYEKEYNCPMDEQEFLDRMDECVLTFFLDEDKDWVSCEILINSWRVVLNNVEIE